MFQCGLCKNHYSRLDHLSRHVRSHTQSKPYQCHICTKSFGRTDLLRRHLVAHGLSTNAQQSGQHHSRVLRDAPDRVSQACRACAANHLRCTEKKPCQRCVERAIDCIWTPSKLRIVSEHSPETPVQGGIDRSPGGVHHGTSSAPGIPQQPSFAMQGIVLTSPSEVDGVTTDGETGLHAADANHQLFPLHSDAALMPGHWSWFGSQDFDLSTSLDLNDMDLQFLEQYNQHVPFVWEAAGQQHQRLEYTHAPDRIAGDHGAGGGGSDASERASLCAETIRQAYWRFRPSSDDHGAAEEINLSLPSSSSQIGSPETRIPLEKRATRAKLLVAARDKIVTVVVTHCRPENLPLAIESFPTVELLDILVQFYLTSPIAQTDSFIHAATFDPNEKRPELLAAMAAAGAILTGDPTLSKLGYAIQECVRVALPRLWESDNSTIRDLQLLQTFLITLEIGVWSGQSRKVEIAESILMCLVTMLRRDGKMKASGYPDTVLPSADASEDLENAWQTWIYHESFKRLVYRVVQHDSFSSLTLLGKPCIPPAELTLPFPSSAALWSAIDARTWRSMFPSGCNPRKLALVDYLDDPEGFLAHAPVLDMAVARSAFLSCAWTLCWEHSQLESLQRASARRWNGLLLASRRDELLRLLNHFRICMGPQPALQHGGLALRLEHILLHLHTSLEDIHVFAGMEGPDAARAIRPIIAAWTDTEMARRAIWHAGQVLRLARAMPKKTIQEASAVMVYHAGLALWVYGLLSDDGRLGERWANGAGGGGLPPVGLEDVETLATQRFVQFGTGMPHIKGVDTSQGRAVDMDIPLSRPDKVMEVVVGILCGNHEGTPRPPLVERLVRLMMAVQQSSGTK
ncbi:hypothetical protein QBC47DRAFT_436271 [Echria macrotheca]|uniref:Uncharacterized protein n=1 Tax=Echria macrotheca TaxID=438768 RepID=A0AAJ0FF87_9PEZI|nr:hypothetical protein QBC47DRAFT_436271 [Echria macrotheca]